MCLVKRSLPHFRGPKSPTCLFAGFHKKFRSCKGILVKGIGRAQLIVEQYFGLIHMFVNIADDCTLVYRLHSRIHKKSNRVGNVKSQKVIWQVFHINNIYSLNFDTPFGFQIKFGGGILVTRLINATVPILAIIRKVFISENFATQQFVLPVKIFYSESPVFFLTLEPIWTPFYDAHCFVFKAHSSCVTVGAEKKKRIQHLNYPQSISRIRRDKNSVHGSSSIGAWFGWFDTNKTSWNGGHSGKRCVVSKS